MTTTVLMGDRLSLFYTAYGDEYTPLEIMDIVSRYEALYDDRQVPITKWRFLAMLRRETGWPIVMRKTGMKRWVALNVRS